MNFSKGEDKLGDRKENASRTLEIGMLALLEYSYDVVGRQLVNGKSSVPLLSILTHQ